MNTIAIDCGASFIKGALIQKGIIIKRKSFKSPPVHNQKKSILFPDYINSLIPKIKELIIDLAENEKEISLCISNEMHGFILAYPDGTPFTDYISWQKEYGSIPINGISSVDILKSPKHEESVLYSGMPLRAGLPTCNLLYLLRSGLIDSAKEKLYFYTMGDYILKCLSAKEPLCHITNAAASGFVDLRTKNWNHNLIEAAMAEKIVFPKIGTEEFEFKFNGIIIHALPAIGDQQAALLGSGLDNDDSLSFNLGTGAQVSKIVSEIKCSKKYQIRPYFNGKYLKTIPHLPSGRALNVYLRFFKDLLQKLNVEADDDYIWNILINSEAEYTCNDLSVDLSFFENPITNNTYGSIEHISEDNFNISNLIHAVFHQLADNFLWAANIIEPDKEKINTLIFSGGIAGKIESIRKIILKYYDHKTEIKIAIDETLLGLYKYGQEYFHY